MILINCSIEPIENRYSKQWDVWFRNYFQDVFSGHYTKVINVYGDVISGNGSVGDKLFLNPIDTNIWKSSQMAKILRLIKSEKENGEKEFGVFFHDLWFPGIEQLKYVESALKISIKIFGIFHAGTWDSEDFLSKMGMKDWARGFELGWMKIAEKIFVATSFHKNLILKCFLESNSKEPGVEYKNLEKKIHITFLPVLDSLDLRSTDLAFKKPWIAFPHRVVAEKGERFLRTFMNDIARLMPGLEVKITHEHSNNKKEFYELLSKCRWSVSLASQETFGISMIESLFSGCIPIVPDMLSYPEVFLDMFRYGGSFEYKANKAVELMQKIDKMDIEHLTEILAVNKLKVRTKCDAAIPEIGAQIFSSMTQIK